MTLISAYIELFFRGDSLGEMSGGNVRIPPASYPFPYHLPASHGQRTSFSVLRPSVSATKPLLLVRSPISIDSSVLFSVLETLSIFLQIHILQVSIFFSTSCLCPCLATIK